MILCVIPARMGSTRLPGKPLLADTGKPMIVHTCEQVAKCKNVNMILVATDSCEVVAAVRARGFDARMTRADHPTGLDRVAEVASTVPGADIVVNVQGDEPEVDPWEVDRVADILTGHSHAHVATLSCSPSCNDLWNPSRVKVKVDGKDWAMFFSRLALPDSRIHRGIYAYRREALLRAAEFGACGLERAESLEQMRFLYLGMKVAVDEHLGSSPGGVDTREDYDAFVARWRAANPTG